MKTYISLLLNLIFGISVAYAQIHSSANPQFPDNWNTRWITHPDIEKTAYGLIHFRNTFDLVKLPEQFVVHVSGDNRYRMYVNGKEVGYGPQLADVRHWRYETYDLAPFLQKGKNIIAVEVMNWGIDRSYGIMSFQTGFLLQGNTAYEQFLNTGYDSQWKVLKNLGMHEKTVFWRGDDVIVGGFYASNPTDSIHAAQYPWGWQSLEYDDNDWNSPEVIAIRPTTAGTSHGWILQPRTTAYQKNKKEPFNQIVRTEKIDLDKEFSFGKKPLEILANTQASILIDQGYVTLGYPKLQLSKGNGAHIEVKYAEALYDANDKKGNRNDLEGKILKGISDVYMMDGGNTRTFQPIWFRAFRFVQLEIETQEEPLMIDDFYNVYSATDFPVKAEFKTTDPSYQRIWDLCWHTLKVCAQDNLMSDAYYEQLQYVGDLRPHLKGWTALTGDLSYFKSAIEQFNNSRLPDGNITSCYPLKATFVHPPYSLVWIDMLHDLMMLEGEKEHIKPYMGEIQEVFDYYESIINEQGLVGKSEYQMFVDWYLPDGGNSPVNKDGNSAILTLNYAYTLLKASEILEWLGYRERSSRYRDQGRKYAEIVRKLCFDETRNIYADDPEHTFYDQRASILAILCGAHSTAEAQQLMRKTLDSNTPFDSKANLFYYLYLFEAMEKTGIGDFTDQLAPWLAILEMGMSGTPEKRVEQNPRSEIHPWAAHPVHYYFSVVAGIKPTKPGFASVAITPNLGKLKEVSCSYPTIRGEIKVDYTIDSKGTLTGTIALPASMTGTLYWNGEERILLAGINNL